MRCVLNVSVELFAILVRQDIRYGQFRQQLKTFLFGSKLTTADRGVCVYLRLEIGFQVQNCAQPTMGTRRIFSRGGQIRGSGDNSPPVGLGMEPR